MAKGKEQFIGQAGQHHVAYSLSVREYHAVITGGNVPAVDILVSTGDGARLLSFQVKTARNAHRARRYGYEVREWHVSASASGQDVANLWYAFVDLQEKAGVGQSSWDPVVFMVPSRWVGAFVQRDAGLKMYLLRAELWPACRERWDRIQGFLSNDANTLTWAETIPPESRPW